ncbi:MAG: transglutaminase-like putative cysteine protease [Lentisphaeria bacterium]|jgi:transglutaminase-like putative cysteine protease
MSGVSTLVSRTSLAWLLFAQGVSIIPLFFNLPTWLPAVWLLTVIWRFQIFRGAWPFPKARTKFVLAVVCVAGLLISYTGTIGVEPMVAFLVVSFVLKLVEMRSPNDVLLIVFIAFFSIAAHFIFYQTIFMAIYSAAAIVVLIFAWMGVYRTRPESFTRAFSRSLILFAQCLPLMLVLFLVLPRIGALWNVPLAQSIGTTGFSDSMSPGDFTALSQSQAPAFRVTFDDPGRIPPQHKRYWRALVLDQFDGRRWQYSRTSSDYRLRRADAPPEFWGLYRGNPTSELRYQVLLEPHQQRWLFTLMAPLNVESSGLKVRFTDNFLVGSISPVASRSQYTVTSVLDYRGSPEGISNQERRQSLQLPRSANPKTLALAQQWLGSGASGMAIVQRALDMYRADFTYTMRPPPPGTNSVDEFLFYTRRGFCEHFASSFVTLMRAAGVPARVVVGYQGGELNPLENYLLIRQSDAHAWAEVWQEGQGWLRVDPTAAVSPLRIEQGLQQSLEDSEQSFMRSGIFSSKLFSMIRLRADALSYSWHKWVLAYDTRQQADVLKNLLGGTDVWRIAGFLLAVYGFVLTFTYLWLTWRGRIKYSTPEQQHYASYMRFLAKKGFVSQTGETPHAFAERVAVQKPLWRSQLVLIASTYSCIAYGGRCDQLAYLRSLIREFRSL